MKASKRNLTGLTNKCCAALMTVIEPVNEDCGVENERFIKFVSRQSRSSES